MNNKLYPLEELDSKEVKAVRNSGFNPIAFGKKNNKIVSMHGDVYQISPKKDRIVRISF